MKKGTLVFNKNFKIDKVERMMFGSFVEHLGRCVYNGVYQPGHPEADELGFRNDVKELIKELGVTAIRYPGGNFVSGYDWKDGVGPKDERVPRKNLAWNVIETNEVGLNEFMSFLKDCSCDAIMAVNLGTGTPKEAGELVEYCNLPEGTYWSNLRKKHGVDKPYQIKYWCLGNEMDGFWQINALTAGEYARKAREAAKIMKWVDPSIELIACGSCTNEIGHNTFGDWDLEVLEETYDYIEYLSLHRYYNYNPEKQLAYPNRDNESDIPYFFTDLKEYLSTIISVCDFVKGKKRSDKKINISFDEWGVISDTSAIPGGVGQEYGFASFKLIDAVIYGGLMCTFMNHADRVKIACQSLLVNEGGMISTSPEGKVIRQATFYPFKDVAHFGFGVALKGVGDIPTVATDHHGEQPSLVASCVYNEETGEVTVFAANVDMHEDLELNLSIEGFGDLKGLAWHELYNDNPYAKNTFEQDKVVVPTEKELNDASDGKISIILKKHSWNVLRFKIK